MTKVKLEETKDRRRLNIGSYFVDLNETDYQELVRIFSDQSRKADAIKSVCEHTVHDLVYRLEHNAKCKCGKEWNFL